MTKTIRNTLLASGAALILSTGIAAAAPATAESDVNLRTGPGTEYPVVGVLRAGETVDVASCTGSWCRVRSPSGTGFASRSYLALAGGAPSVGVAVTPGYAYEGYAYNDYPYGYDDGYYGYDYGPSFGFSFGGRFHRDRRFDHNRWNGTRTGAWNGSRSGGWQGAHAGTWQGGRGGTWHGRANVGGNVGGRVGSAAPGSVTPMQHSAPNMSAQTGLRGGASAPSGGGSFNAGARVGGGGGHVGGGGGGGGHAGGGGNHHH